MLCVRRQLLKRNIKQYNKINNILPGDIRMTDTYVVEILVVS